jgi:phage terminase large subunit GpA-like protein
VNEALLAPNNSYGAPVFVYRGHYLDTEFTCENCGKEQIWTATQQKWWYEVAKGFAYSTAKLCRACRALVRAHKDESRRISLAGLARKKARSQGT